VGGRGGGGGCGGGKKKVWGGGGGGEEEGGRGGGGGEVGAVVEGSVRPKRGNQEGGETYKSPRTTLSKKTG